jgi:hypothetical protein
MTVLKNLLLTLVMISGLASCQIDEISDILKRVDSVENPIEDNNEEESSDANSESSCTLTTECEEVVFEGASSLSVESVQSDDVFIITVKNVDGEIVYETECAEGASVSMQCSSISSEEDSLGDDDVQEEDNSDIIVEETDNDSEGSCTLTTECEEVVFEGASGLSVASVPSGDVFVITVKNVDGEVVYEAECDQGASVSMQCSSES